VSIPVDTNKGSALRGIAAKLREKAPLMTETYVAYAASQQLMKECTRHADYTVPQALEKNGEIPRDETGAHLGVSESWWFKGRSSGDAHACTAY
jgi:cytochrome b pre-mRNA-processing protein 3